MSNPYLEALWEIRRIANEPGDRRALIDKIYGIATEAGRIPDPAQAQTGCDKEATFGEDGYNPAYDDGITFAIVQLAELTGSKDWQMRDGSEDHDTDVRDTIMDVLKCAGIYDDETGKFAALAQASWMPIETAPKDGSYVLISSATLVDIARWSHGSFGGFNRDDELKWQPVPTPYGASALTSATRATPACDCGFAADVCATNHCHRKQIASAGLSPVPAGYSKLPDGVVCKCFKMWRATDGSHWCCLPSPLTSTTFESGDQRS